MNEVQDHVYTWRRFIIKLMRSNKLTKTGMARRCGVSRETVHYWLRACRQPHEETRLRVERAFNVVWNEPSTIEAVEEVYYARSMDYFLELCGINQKELATLSGISELSINLYANGIRIPGIINQALIIEVFKKKSGLSIGEIYERLHKSALRDL